MKWQVQVRLSHVTFEPIRWEDLTQVNPNPLGKQYSNLIGPVRLGKCSYGSVLLRFLGRLKTITPKGCAWPSLREATIITSVRSVDVFYQYLTTFVLHYCILFFQILSHRLFVYHFNTSNISRTDPLPTYFDNIGGHLLLFFLFEFMKFEPFNCMFAKFLVIKLITSCYSSLDHLENLSKQNR